MFSQKKYMTKKRFKNSWTKMNITEKLFFFPSITQASMCMGLG